MKRRNFIGTATIATAGISSIISSCNNSKNIVAATGTETMPAGSFELDEASISSLQENFVSGKYTSQEVTRQYLERIKTIDQAGPLLHAVIEVNPDAMAIAKAMDEERKAGKSRGPLHGIPVLIKDNIDTGDKMQTTAGSLAMVGNIAANDAFIVKKLREAGAVLLGKTNLSEWANFRSSSSCSGWSSRGGQTKNPYILDHNPCGSSAGSGVAVSANLCTVAIGTETDGSVVCPSAVSGIVGMKPTVGLLSRSGIIPISSTQDTAGPMGRTVTDVALLLGILTGQDGADAVTAESKGKAFTDYTPFLKADGLKGKRIGIEDKPQGDNPLLHALINKAVQLLKDQGASIIKISYADQVDKLGNSEFELMQYEFKAGLNKYLAASNAPVRSLKEVIEFNKKNESIAMPYFKQETLVDSQAKGDLDSVDYRKAVQRSHEGTKNILDKVINDNKLDAICGLTMGPACSIDSIYGDRWGNVFLTQPAAASGYPHITVPAGMAYDLPVGLSFFGAAYTEPVLLGIAYAYEQASQHRKVPGFKKAFLD